MKNKDELSLEMMKKEVLEITNLSFKQGQASRQAEIIEMINERIKSGFTDEGDKWILRDLKQQILEEKKSETEKTNRRKTTYKRIRR